MDKTSPREILLHYGKWIGATDFAKLVAKKRDISERQAKTLISDAYDDKDIKKHLFPDRSVIYGLTEFGPPINKIDSFESPNQEAELQSKPKTITHQQCAETKTSDEVEPTNALDEKNQQMDLSVIVEKLRREELNFFREPTINEIATKASIDPEIVKTFLFSLSAQGNWKIQLPQQAEKEAKEAINLTTWLGWKEKGEQNPRLEGLYRQALNCASSDVLKRAKDILTNFPDLVPTVWVEPEMHFEPSKRPTCKGIVDPFASRRLIAIDWPEKTKNRWRCIFGSEPPLPQFYE